MVFAASCDQTPELELFEGNFVAFTDTGNLNVLESDGDISLSAEVAQGAGTSDVTITLTTSGDAVEGVDFDFPNGKTIVIPAGDFTGSTVLSLIDNDVFSNAKTLIVEITASTASGADIGLSEESSFRKTITINNDDCQDDVRGSYASSGLWGRGDGAGGTGDDPLLGPFDYTATVELVGCSGNEVTYLLSDITAGLYALGYGSADNPATIVHNLDTNGISVSTADSPDVVYGGDEFSGSGSYDPGTGSFTLDWANGYGDQGSTVYTPQ